MKSEVKDMPALRVAAIRHLGPYDQISAAFAKLGGIAGHAGLFGPDATMLAIYYDDPDQTSAAKLCSDAGVTVSPSTKIPAGLEERKMPAGRFATTTHVGPYEKLPDAWRQLKREIASRGEHRVKAGAPSYEIYRNTPGTVPKEQLITELYLPLDA